MLRTDNMSKQKRKQLGLTEKQAETYEQCLGQCSGCLLHGECEIQKKIKGPIIEWIIDPNFEESDNE